MNAPAWKAITEKQTVDYCAFRHLYKKPENILQEIDLFAGYSSLRAVAKAQGLNYLAVDMRDLMSAAKGSAATGKE